MEAARPSTDAPLVSICVPTYNDERFLRASLASIVGQTYPNLEVLVGDDASTDGTADVVRTFGDPRIRYHRNNQNLGQFANVNSCIARAAGDYVAVYHSDDEYEPTIVEKEVGFLESTPEAAAVFALDRWIDSAGRVIGETQLPPDVPEKKCLEMADILPVLLRRMNCVLRGPTFMCRRTVFDEVGMFEPDLYDMAGDLEFWLRILTRFRVGIVREPLMRYRQDEAQISRRYYRLRTDEDHFFPLMRRYLSESGLAETVDRATLTEFDFHVTDDETTRAANLVILGRYREARALLGRSFPWRTLRNSVTRQKLRAIALRAVLRLSLAVHAGRLASRLLVRVEHAGRL